MKKTKKEKNPILLDLKCTRCQCVTRHSLTEDGTYQCVICKTKRNK